MKEILISYRDDKSGYPIISFDDSVQEEYKKQYAKAYYQKKKLEKAKKELENKEK